MIIKFKSLKRIFLKILPTSIGTDIKEKIQKISDFCFLNFIFIVYFKLIKSRPKIYEKILNSIKKALQGLKFENKLLDIKFNDRIYKILIKSEF